MPVDPHEVDRLRDRFFSIASEELAAQTLKKLYLRRLGTCKIQIHRFLERPGGCVARLYHSAVFGLIVCIHIASAMAEKLAHDVLVGQLVRWLEIFLTIHLVAEFLVRLWAIGADAHYRGIRGRLSYMFRPICLIDVAVIVFSLFALFMRDEPEMQQRNDAKPESNAADMLRMVPPSAASSLVEKFRFIQILRLLHVDRQMSAVSLVKRMVKRSRFELVSAYYITFIIFLFLAVSVFTTEEMLEEKKIGGGDSADEKRTFDNYGDSFWLSVVTVLTIGYGDIVPRAWLSKLAICLLSYLGLSMFSTASNLVGVGMSLMLNGEKQQRQQSKVRDMAARLIQCWLRFQLMSNRQRFLQIRIYRRFCAKLQRVEERIRKGKTMARMATERKQQRKQLSKLLSLNAQKQSPMTERKVSCAINSLQQQLQLSVQLMRSDTFPTPIQQEDQQIGDLSDEEEPILDFYYNLRSHTNSLHSSKSNDAGGATAVPNAHHYQQILRMCYFLLFMDLRKKFKRARNPYELVDAEAELCQLEHQRMQKFRELEMRLSSQLGAKSARFRMETKSGKSENSKEGKERANNASSGSGLMERLETCEQRVADMRRKVEFIEHLAGMIYNGFQQAQKREEPFGEARATFV